MLAELTRCMSDAYTARSRIFQTCGRLELALADLNHAIRLAPDNAEALQLRGLIEHKTGEGHPAQDNTRQSDLDDPTRAKSGPRQTRFQAGYQVMARYPHCPEAPDEPLHAPFPPTDEGFRGAIDFAKYICHDEGRQMRREIRDAYFTWDENFDAVVIEFRSLAREVYLEKGVDDDGNPIKG